MIVGLELGGSVAVFALGCLAVFDGGFGTSVDARGAVTAILAPYGLAVDDLNIGKRTQLGAQRTADAGVGGIELFGLDKKGVEQPDHGLDAELVQRSFFAFAAEVWNRRN